MGAGAARPSLSMSTSNKAFPWSPVTDKVEGMTRTADCNDPEDDEFWINMCGPLDEGREGSASFVDLAKNPERWTGFNGSHIWQAIYDENCFEISPETCYEERVLYKLLSGMHASVNIHIALNYHPPSKRKQRTKWTPNPAA